MDIKFKKIKKGLSNLLLSLTKHDFLASLFLYILAIAVGILVFYNYCFLVQKSVESDVSAEHYSLDKKKIDNILKVWESNEEKFEETNTKEYPNIL